VCQADREVPSLSPRSVIQLSFDIEDLHGRVTDLEIIADSGMPSSESPYAGLSDDRLMVDADNNVIARQPVRRHQKWLPLEPGCGPAGREELL
jgi:hypothetical protein